MVLAVHISNVLCYCLSFFTWKRSHWVYTQDHYYNSQVWLKDHLHYKCTWKAAPSRCLIVNKVHFELIVHIMIVVPHVVLLHFKLIVHMM